MKIACIIPARYASTRLPGKPLLDINGKPMIEHVYQRARQAKLPSEVIVATDDERIFNAVREFGGQAVMTSPNHMTGTDRLAEVAQNLTADVIINVQGDEPLISPEVIDLVAEPFAAEPELSMATLKTRLQEDDYHTPSVVKVITDLQGYALYFSRSLIPYPRVQTEQYHVYKHIGIYAYRRDFLLTYANLPPTPLEIAESLEQLRALEHGYRIKVLETDFSPVGVDTEEDLEKVRMILRG